MRSSSWASVVARGLRLVKAATHCESVRLRQCPLRLSLYFRLFSRPLETETDLSRWRICVSSQTIQTQLDAHRAIFLIQTTLRTAKVYFLLQGSVTDRIMSQIMSLDADENCSLAEKGDLVAIGTRLSEIINFIRFLTVSCVTGRWPLTLVQLQRSKHVKRSLVVNNLLYNIALSFCA